MVQMTTSKAREDFSGTLKRVRGGERVLLNNHKKAVAAIVSVDDLELLRALEDKIDLAAIRVALDEPGTVAWEDVKGQLGVG